MLRVQLGERWLEKDMCVSKGQLVVRVGSLGHCGKLRDQLGEDLQHQNRDLGRCVVRWVGSREVEWESRAHGDTLALLALGMGFAVHLS